VEPIHPLGDVIYVMEDRHVRRAQEDVWALLKDKRVINLHIPDITNTWMRADRNAADQSAGLE